MEHKYPVITLCGSTRFKEEFFKAQKELTLKGYIVISVGLFGHSGDTEVWENMNEETLTETKAMLDDMHKSKIDMADEIFVINPGGYIGASTWSEVCYAHMCGKPISSLEPINERKIAGKISMEISLAEAIAWHQYDIYSHTASDGPMEMITKNMAVLRKGKEWTIDPWVPKDESVPIDTEIFYGHASKDSGYDPFKVYGRQKMARFISDILLLESLDEGNELSREALLAKACAYKSIYRDEIPDGCDFEAMSISELRDFVETWSEFDPYKNL